MPASFPRWRWAATLALASCAGAHADHPDDVPTRSVGVVTVRGANPSSLPTQIPTTMESATRAEIERRVNATDSQDALKYFPSLLVRKRYPGDYNHAILSSRASGTGNSARSAVYADGILLSNFLGNGVGGLAFPPRWGLVTSEEIERVDVMYGPFSAAYPGNSVGAVVDYVTRMPTRFEAHARMAYQQQPFELYGTRQTFHVRQTSASLGNRAGAFAWWLNLHRTDSEGQPQTYATRMPVQAVATTPATPVTGAVPGLNNANQPWWILGSGTQYRTQQDHLKLKLAYDLTPALRASYVFGLWRNDSEGKPASYLRDAAGRPVYAGTVAIDGRHYTLGGGDFPLTRERLQHQMHGLTLKSHSRGEWDWEIAASLVDYQRDDKRQNAAANTLPAAASGGAGTIAQGQGSGWDTLAFKGSWRPAAAAGAHAVDFGAQQERYRLRYRTSAIAGNYLADAPGALASEVHGDTALRSLWAQDVWRFAEDWKAVLGLRLEQWSASEGRSNGLAYPSRRERQASPKFALSWQAREATLLKFSLGRALRMPTVAELYGATSTTHTQSINDPNLRPERSWTAELSAEQSFAAANARLTLFAEDTRNALYSQTLFDTAAGRNITRVQNVGRIVTTGVEAALRAADVGWRGLNLQASLTYADSKVKRNDGFVAAPGDTVGRWQPNIPRWRASAVADYRLGERWTVSVAARYSGRQYRTLNNADVNGMTYMGVSQFFVVDLRAQARLGGGWTAAVGIDNLNNQRYWNFHPYPQRTYHAELRYDL